MRLQESQSKFLPRLIRIVRDNDTGPLKTRRAVKPRAARLHIRLENVVATHTIVWTNNAKDKRSLIVALVYSPALQPVITSNVQPILGV